MRKNYHNAEKTERGTLWNFSTSILSQNSEKIEWKKFPKKSRNAEKTERGPFCLVRYCMLRGKLFWFSSLGQRVQFGVFLKFCRTILVTSGVSKKKFEK